MDICQLILDEHAEQRRHFAHLEEIGPGDEQALAVIWKRLRALLDSHAAAEELHFYPRLMQIGEGANDAPSAAEETRDAIEDHNEIRDTAAAVDEHPVGSDAWFEALGRANLANSKHMAEEERQGLTDFRRHASIDERHALGIRFATFEARHVTGVEPVNHDPDRWVAAHEPG